MKKLENIFKLFSLVIVAILVIIMIVLPIERSSFFAACLILFYAGVNLICAFIRLKQRKEYAFWGFMVGASYFICSGLFILDPLQKSISIFLDAAVIATIVSLYGLANCWFRKNGRR